MTRLEYDLLREQNPHLRLPSYRQLRDQEREKLLKGFTQEELIVARTYILLARDLGVVDAVR